jgi:hypothetical protein
MSNASTERTFDSEALELYGQLRDKFKTDSAISDAIGVPRKTLADWFQRGFAPPKPGSKKDKWRRVKLILKSGLEHD